MNQFPQTQQPSAFQQQQPAQQPVQQPMTQPPMQPAQQGQPQQGAPMGMQAFQGIGNVTRGFQSNTIRATESGVSYIVRVDKCEMIQTQTSGQRWKNSLTVLAVLDGGPNPHQVGETVNTFFNVTGNIAMFQQNVKGFVAGILNCEDARVGENEIQQVLEQQLLAGKVCVVTARTQASKSSVDPSTGQPRRYNVYQWGAQLTPQEIAERIGAEAMQRFFPNGFQG